MNNVTADSDDIAVAAVKGTNSAASPAVGVEGESAAGWGVHGRSTGGRGVVGTSESGPGGWFSSTSDEAVRGTSGSPGHGGVVGVNTASGTGLHGTSQAGVGVWGASTEHEGVHAETRSAVTAALAAYQVNAASESAAFYAKHLGGRTAAFLEGSLVVTRDVSVGGDIVLTNADCAEDFDVHPESPAEPGSVMALDDDGRLRECAGAYDRRVTGVVSGAGGLQPGVILDRQPGSTHRQPVALMGKVFCKVDADFGAVAVGDMLTTSPTPGHAMRADDALRAFGAVLGKALRPLERGQAMIPVLVTLQ